MPIGSVVSSSSCCCSYTSIAAGDGSAALASNPELRTPPAPAPPAATADALRALTARLKDAYNGVEVQWKDSGKLYTLGRTLSCG